MTGRFQYCPHFKPKKCSRYLHSDSGHSHAVHRAWPRAELARFKRLSASSFQFGIASQIFKARHLSDRIYVNWHHRPNHHGRQRSHTVWITVPYHPSLIAVGVPKAISQLSSKWFGHLPFQDGNCQVRVSWALQQRGLGHFLRQEFQA